MSRVRIGTCAGPADAALVRAMFAAHDIPVLIGAEQHAGMLGGMAGAFLSLDILVDSDDAEDAAALLHDLRTSEPVDAGPDEEDEDDDEGRDDDIAGRMDRRRRTGIALLLGFCVTFGTAHMFTRAWLRGVVLAGVEIFAFTRVIVAPTAGVILLIATILFDAIGAVIRVRRGTRASIPRAQVARR